VCIDRAPTDSEQKITKKRKFLSDEPTNLRFLSLLLFMISTPSVLLSCKFIAACEDFFGLTALRIHSRAIIGYGNRPTLSFLTVILCGPLSHLRYQRNPRSKLSVAAEPRWVIRGQIFGSGRAALGKAGFKITKL
jgi:hypothetical protein